MSSVFCSTCNAPFVDELALANHVLDYIAKHLSGVEWSPDTIAKVADEIRATGRVIKEPSS